MGGVRTVVEGRSGGVVWLGGAYLANRTKTHGVPGVPRSWWVGPVAGGGYTGRKILLGVA